MIQRDLFSVGARLIGVWVLADAFRQAVTLVDIYTGLFDTGKTPTKLYWVGFVQELLIGLFLTIFAHRLADFLIPSNAPKTPDTPGSDDKP